MPRELDDAYNRSVDIRELGRVLYILAGSEGHEPGEQLWAETSCGKRTGQIGACAAAVWSVLDPVARSGASGGVWAMRRAFRCQP